MWKGENIQRGLELRVNRKAHWFTVLCRAHKNFAGADAAPLQQGHITETQRRIAQ